MRLRRIFAHHVELRVRVRVLHRRPAVGRRIGFVHDQQTRRAAARGFFVLVSPAAVVGHRLAAEVADAGFEIGIVDQHDRDLALQVDALEVVPLALRRSHAVAAEHHRRVGDVDRLGAVERRANGDLAALGQRLSLAADIERGFRRAFDFRAQQRHGLRPCALAVLEVAARRQAGALHLPDDIGDRLRLARRGRAAAFEFVRGQRLHFRRQQFRIEFRRVSRRVRGDGRGGNRQGNGGRKQCLHEAPVILEEGQNRGLRAPVAGEQPRRGRDFAVASGAAHPTRRHFPAPERLIVSSLDSEPR